MTSEYHDHESADLDTDEANAANLRTGHAGFIDGIRHEERTRMQPDRVVLLSGKRRTEDDESDR